MPPDIPNDVGVCVRVSCPRSPSLDSPTTPSVDRVDEPESTSESPASLAVARLVRDAGRCGSWGRIHHLLPAGIHQRAHAESDFSRLPVFVRVGKSRCTTLDVRQAERILWALLRLVSFASDRTCALVGCIPRARFSAPGVVMQLSSPVFPVPAPTAARCCGGRGTASDPKTVTLGSKASDQCRRRGSGVLALVVGGALAQAGPVQRATNGTQFTAIDKGPPTPPKAP